MKNSNKHRDKELQRARQKEIIAYIKCHCAKHMYKPVAYTVNGVEFEA